MDVKRTWMFVPGHAQRFIDKAMSLSCDVMMLDIEDGVTPGEKPAARELIAEALGRPKEPGGPVRFVRINAVGGEHSEADLRAAVRPGLEGLVLPKVESAQEVQTVAAYLDGREAEVGLERGSVALAAAIETPRGLFNALAIADSSPRLVALMFGAEDYGWELGLPAVREEEAAELIHARSSIVAAARAAHIQPVDGVWPDLGDEDGLRLDIAKARRLGFGGKALFHPSQIDAINAAFAPTPAEIDYAERVTDAFDEAFARGEGSIAFEGRLVDRPIAERARATLRLADGLGLR
ncbi:MAG: CoA ester lyase [Chloroflexi bacterium]|nr:CoA ester lyase [Chloroflexota bacterium]